MRLSMWILADELKKYQIEGDLRDPSLTVERVRIAQTGSPCPDWDKSTAWITMDDSCGCVLVTCQTDRIKVGCCSVNEVLELIQGAFEKYTAWYESIFSRVIDESLTEIVSSSAEILGVRLTAVDLNTLSIAASAAPADVSDMSVLASAVQDGLLKPPVLNAIEQRADCISPFCQGSLYGIGPESFALLPAQSESGQYLLIAEGSRCCPGMACLFTCLEQALHIWVRLHPSAKEESVLRQMLTGQPIRPEKGWSYLERFGLQQSELYVLYDIYVNDNTSMPAAAIAAWLNQQPHEGSAHAWICPDNAKEIILIFSGTLEEKLHWDRLLTGYLENLPVICGMSGGDDDLSNLSTRYQCARLAAQHDFEAGVKIRSYEAAFLNTVKALCEERHLLTLLPALRFLKEQDRKTGSDFYRTLNVYFMNCQNQTTTAKELFISRAGLQHRLRSIREILNIDFTKTEYRLALELSYYFSKQDLAEEEDTESADKEGMLSACLLD